MKKILRIILILSLFGFLGTDSVLAECAKVKIALRHFQNPEYTFPVGGSPQKITDENGPLRCLRQEEIIDRVLHDFPHFILKEYKEAGESSGMESIDGHFPCYLDKISVRFRPDVAVRRIIQIGAELGTAIAGYSILNDSIVFYQLKTIEGQTLDEIIEAYRSLPEVIKVHPVCPLELPF